MADYWYTEIWIYPWDEATRTRIAELPEGKALLEFVHDGEDPDDPRVIGPEIDEDYGGEIAVHLVDEQGRYGSSQWCNEAQVSIDGVAKSVTDLCEALGLSYHYEDEGMYEFAGESVTWTPEDGEEHKTIVNGGAIALTFGEFCELETQAAGDDSKLVRLISEYLCVAEGKAFIEKQQALHAGDGA